MKIILPGYEGTKKILSANSYFLSKYMPGFDVYFLNYGKFDGKLYCGKYISLDDTQVGGQNAWAKYLREYLDGIDDELVILADGDFFVTKPYHEENYEKLLGLMQRYLIGYMSCGEDPKKFSRIAQYAIWNRKFLLSVLNSHNISSIWRFESRGGKHLVSMQENGFCKFCNALADRKTIYTWLPVVNFDPRSAISYNRASFRNLVGVGQATKEDVEFLISNGHLKREELIIELARHGKPIVWWDSNK